MSESFNDFRKEILKVDGKRHHEIKNSIGIRDVYKHTNKEVDYKTFSTIVKAVNKELGLKLLEGHDINLPARMGLLEIRKYDAKIAIDNNGKVITNLPIDWIATLKLWYEDEKAKENKTLVKINEKEMFKLRYIKCKAVYNNKAFYEFKFSRELKKTLKNRIKDNLVDTYKI